MVNLLVFGQLSVATLVTTKIYHSIMSVIIAGIHTGIGKTLCSAILCEAWGYDYWKPVQAGDLESSDSLFIKKQVRNPLCTIHPEAYRLQIAASPHFAAAQEGIEIELHKLVLPQSQNPIVVETAGGIMSPLNANLLNIHLIKHLNLPVILVSENYLGSINHTLMTISLLQQAQIPIQSIVFNGEKVASSMDFILEYSKIPLLFTIPKWKTVNHHAIKTLIHNALIR
jgi:dethiobiotin synthetase